MNFREALRILRLDEHARMHGISRPRWGKFTPAQLEEARRVVREGIESIEPDS